MSYSCSVSNVSLVCAALFFNSFSLICLAGLSLFCTVVPCRLLFTQCARYRNWVSLRLSILYAADLAHIAEKHGVTIHSFADDTQLYLHCIRDDTSQITVRVAHCIADINHWMSANRLKLNTNKLCGKPRHMPSPLYAARCSPAPDHTRLTPAAPIAPCAMNIHDRQAVIMVSSI